MVADGRDDGFLLYKSIAFGVGGSPLIWGLGASMRKRSDQSLLEMTELGVELSDDGPAGGHAPKTVSRAASEDVKTKKGVRVLRRPSPLE
jgi:hypothetical protein